MKWKKIIASVLSCAAFAAACFGYMPVSAEDADMSDYVLLDWQPQGNCYWNSADQSLYNQLITIDNKPEANNLGQFVSSKRMFTKDDIPVGSYIQIDRGYQYRPEEWTEDRGKNESQDRPGNVKETEVYVDEEWWGDSMYKAFNVSAEDGSHIGNKVDEIRNVLRIYVPKDENIPEPAPTETAAPPSEPTEDPEMPGEVPYDPDKDKDGTLKILAIGNSFSEDAMEYLYNIATHSGFAKDKVVLGNLFIGGGTLQQHYENSQNGTAYNLQKRDGSNSIVTFSRTLQNAVKDEDWDIITLQQASGSSGMADTYEPYLSALIEIIEENATNADMKLGWHMTWAYQQDVTHDEFYKYDNDQMTMYNAIVGAVEEKVLPTGKFDFVIPSGTAVQNMRTSFAGDTLTRDGYHMGYVLGRYIIGLTWFRTITGMPLDSVAWEPMTVGDNFKTLSTSPFDWIYISDDAMEAAKEAIDNAYEVPFEITKSSYAEYTGEYPYIISQPEISADKCSAVFTKIGNTEAPVVLVVAVYDSKGNLVKVDTLEKTLENGVKTKMEILGEFSKGCRLKAFVFNDVGSIEPLAYTIESVL